MDRRTRSILLADAATVIHMRTRLEYVRPVSANAVLINMGNVIHVLTDSGLVRVMSLFHSTAIANIGGSIPAAPVGLGLFELIAREVLFMGLPASVDRSPKAC